MVTLYVLTEWLILTICCLCFNQFTFFKGTGKQLKSQYNCFEFCKVLYFKSWAKEEQRPCNKVCLWMKNLITQLSTEYTKWTWFFFKKKTSHPYKGKTEIILFQVLNYDVMWQHDLLSLSILLIKTDKIHTFS